MIVLILLYFALWSVQKNHAILSTNQMHAKLKKVTTTLSAVWLFLIWVLIGPWRYFPLFWLAVVITLVFSFMTLNHLSSSKPGRMLAGASSVFPSVGSLHNFKFLSSTYTSTYTSSSSIKYLCEYLNNKLISFFTNTIYSLSRVKMLKTKLASSKNF